MDATGQTGDGFSITSRTYRCLLATTLACIVIGIALSNCIEPGVRVQTVTLAGDTPALKFTPADSGPHPVTLLAHGVTASKETLFRIAEALTAAGFICYAVDLPGHGQSSHRFSDYWPNGPSANEQTLASVAHAIGPVDVFVGHSMGAYAGGETAALGGLAPRLFIAVGALPGVPEKVPLLLLSGKLDEAVSPDHLKLQTDAQLKLFAGCDHALEPYDPRLVNAAVDAACAAVGKTPPSRPTRWILRSLGGVLGLLGAPGILLLLPKLSARCARLRGPLVAAIFISVLVLTMGTWMDATPHLRRAWQQIPLMLMATLVVAVAGVIHVPRWSFSALMTVIWIALLTVGAYFPGLIAMLGAIALLAGAFLGWIASRRGSRLDGDIAMGIFVGYAVGQCFPLII